MGSIKSDQSQDTHRERPFSSATTSATEKASMSTLLMAILFVASLFLLYRFADWYHRKQVSEAAAIPLAASAPPQPPATLLPSAEPTGQSQASVMNVSTAEPAVKGHVVTKCTIDGKTSYGDGPCARGAITTLVTTRPDSNIIAPTRVQPLNLPPSAALQPAPVVAQANGVSPLEAKKADCDTLDAHIKTLDAMSRQPQDAPTMDRINDERRIARDQQFRIQCR